MIDRFISPETTNVFNIHIPSVKVCQCSDVPLYRIDGGVQPLIKLDVFFQAGDAWANNALIPNFTNALVLESTKKHTSHELAEALDFMGAEINPLNGSKYSCFSLISLTKYFPDAIKILTEMLNEPLFSEEDFVVYRNNMKKQFFVDIQDVSYQARRYFKALLFGKEHPYGKIVDENDFDFIVPEQLKDYFTRLYHKKNVQLFISGDMNNEVLNILNRHFTLMDGTFPHFNLPSVVASSSMSRTIKMEHAIQSAIRIGKTVIPKSHPDYPALQIATTVLGGYFGSRLMQVLREEKGYTYGVGTALVNYDEISYFVVATEVAKEATYDAINCIYHEIDKLCTEEISSTEMENVRSYLLGEFLRSMDGPFNIMETYKAVHNINLTMEYYTYYLDVLTHIQPRKILEVANRYLVNDFIEVIAGDIE